MNPRCTGRPNLHARPSRTRPRVVPLRLRRGATTPSRRICGETDRETHFVPSAAVDGDGTTVTTLCGTRLELDQTEPAEYAHGVPCTTCYLQFLHGTDLHVPHQRDRREW